MEPFFSLIVPTRNRPQALQTLLTALCSLDYPRERFEVIIIWHTSDDSPERVIDPFRERFDIKTVEARRHGPGPARQAGIERAKGEYIAFIDDDCEPSRNWLRAFARALRDDDEIAVGGRVINKLSGNLFSSTSQLLIDYVYALYNANPVKSGFFTTNNAAVSARCLRQMGGFDRDWAIAGAEDRDFWMRWRKAGFRMVYDPQIIVEHSHVMSWKTFWQTHYHYGQGAYYFHRRYAAVRSESRGFFLGLPAFILRSAPLPRSLVYLALACVSQVASAAGLLNEWLHRRSRERSVGASPAS
jgi:GT2 family glycosyltransferase